MHKLIRLILSVLVCTLGAGLLFAETSDFPQTEFAISITPNTPDLRPHRAYNADEAQILTAIYEGLFVYDPFSMDPEPAIAESWSVSPDGLEWVFRIRENARFANGEPITAGTIRNSWINLLDPEISAPYASMFDSISGAAAYRTGEESDPSTVLIVAEDTHTLRVTLTNPAEHLPKILCHHAFSVVHPSDLGRSRKSDPEKLAIPVSSGPFYIDSFTTEEIHLVKNRYYWDSENVSLPSIKILLSDDAESITAKFNRGELHWISGAVLVNRILDSGSIKVTPMFSTEYFFFRGTWGPWATSEVRNALLLSVPWNDLRSNYLIPAKTLVFPISGYPELAGIEEYDPEEAARLLEKAGLTDFSSIPVLQIRIPETRHFESMAETLKEAWEKLGFTVEINMIPYAQYYSSLRNDEYAVGVTSWIGDFADPLAFLEMFRPASSLNDSGWKNTEYEQIITDASGQRSPLRRYEKLAEAEQLLLDDAVILPLSHNPSLNIIDMNGIEGWYPNALDIHPFKFIRFVPKKALPGVAQAPDVMRTPGVLRTPDVMRTPDVLRGL